MRGVESRGRAADRAFVRPRLCKEEGFSMIELVMAMIMLTIGILAIVAAFSSGSVGIRRASRVATAGAIADAQMELYRALRYDVIALDSGSLSSANTDTSYTSDAPPAQVTISCPSLPPECRASQSVTGPDGATYRVDTYISYRYVSTRQGKRVTVVVRDPSVSPPRRLISVPSTFDPATG
jgi:type II secretory pathway pseudopilin PulG